MKKLALCGLLLSGVSLHADQIASTSFKGLNNNENSVIINPAQAQDLLNVDVTPGGKSVKKRQGYGVYKSLGTSAATHGGYHAYDLSGNNYQLWGSSRSLYGIVGDGTPTALVSTATLNSTWDCTDTQGSSYCVDSSRDVYLKTDGTTFSWNTSPLGTMVESTPDRVVVAGVSGSPNTLFISQSNTFTNFTPGVNATDAFQEVIASPGSKLTHIRWGCGKLLWWKDQSFGYFDFDDQFTAQVKTISDSIGTFDNTSAIDPGGQVWFRGQDGHTWMYDCSILTKETVDITPNVRAAGSRIGNSWIQTTQADWQSGSFAPSGNFSTSIVAGDIQLTNYTGGDRMLISSPSLNAVNVDNNSFESGFTNWTAAGVGPPSIVTTATGGCGTMTAEDGTNFVSALRLGTPILRLLTYPGGVFISSVTQTASSCVWSVDFLTVPAAYIGTSAELVVTDDAHGNYTLTSDPFVLNGNVASIWVLKIPHVTDSDYYFDNIISLPKASQGTKTSSTFDSGLTSTTVQLQSSWATSTAPQFSLQTSANGSTGWTSILTSTGTNAAGQRYFRYLSTYTLSGFDAIPAVLSTQTIVALSTGGIFLSAVHNAPSLTSWDLFSADDQTGGGTIAYYVRTSTNSFSVTSSTPAWVAQTKNATVSAAVGTYFQARAIFTSVSSTATLALNDFTFSWFEGAPSDQAYMIYFDNAIWESVAFGAAQSANNYIFKYDLINEGWTQYDFGAGGLLVQSNRLYFGDTSTGGNIFTYGTGTSDNGSAIQAFWRGKSYTGADPFLQNALTNIDVFAKKDQGTTLTSTYTTDTLASTAYSVALSTAALVIQSRKLLPAGKQGYTFDLKVGDTSATSSWELLGYRIGFNQQPYRPTTP